VSAKIPSPKSKRNGSEKLNKNNLFLLKPNAKNDTFSKTKTNDSFLLQMRERKLILLLFSKTKLCSLSKDETNQSNALFNFITKSKKRLSNFNEKICFLFQK
jgi:hypothetical protein